MYSPIMSDMLVVRGMTVMERKYLLKSLHGSHCRKHIGYKYIMQVCLEINLGKLVGFKFLRSLC